jgi:hypothetical protein
MKSVENAYRSFYGDEVFVRIFGPETPQVSTNVRGSNFCNLSLNLDERTGKLIVVSLIDNLVKGQAGFGPVAHRRITMIKERFTAYGLNFSHRQAGAGLKGFGDDPVSGQGLFCHDGPG